MGFFRKFASKMRSCLYVFKKAEIMRVVVNKELNGEYANLCSTCYYNEKYSGNADKTCINADLNQLRLSIYLGGALGDYIVYLRFVDEISSICDCHVDLFLDKIGFAEFVYGKRENITIVHDIENTLFLGSTNMYDLAVHLDHGLTLKGYNLGAIRAKAPLFYETAAKIVAHAKRNQINIPKQHERETIILRQAEFSGDTKWSKLSCGGAVDMREMYSNLLLDKDYFDVLERYELAERQYITVNFGADKNMGGTAQTKVLPLKMLGEFVRCFKEKYPYIIVVQTGVHDSVKIDGVDIFCFDCRLEETAIILKNSLCHIDSEGGLVHLASQMSTCCVVSFGPTPIYYYSYPRNKNILAPECSNCMAVTPNWSTICPRKMQIPICMSSITPQMIMDKVIEVVDVKNKKDISLHSLEKTKVYEAFSKEDAVKRLAVIGEIDKETQETVEKVKKCGWSAACFIDTRLYDEKIAIRTELKKKGITVEYGNALNIARPDNSFDVVLFLAAQKPDEFEIRECKRILTDGGSLYCAV